jgi:DNA ligase 1
VVAWDPSSQQILPFQRLTTRAKKWENHGRDPSVKVALFVFDFLVLNGEPLIMLELRQRLKKLHEIFREVPNQLYFAEEFESNDLQTVQNFFAKSLKSSCEGLMMKCLDGPDSVYRLDYRSSMWLKIKKDYAGMVDTLDLVPIGGFYGQGRRVGLFGSFLLAVYDPDQDEYQSISKCMTGFTDQFLTTAAEELGQTSIDSPLDNYRFTSAVRPDVFFSPTQVWEIQFADFTLSTVHCAAGGLVDEERAVSLRFPRFKRSRTDKKPADATTPMQIAEFYWKLQNDPDLDTFFNRTEAKEEDKEAIEGDKEAIVDEDEPKRVDEEVQQPVEEEAMLIE